MTANIEKRFDPILAKNLRSKFKSHRNSFNLNFISKGREKLKILIEERENLEKSNLTLQEKTERSPIASFVKVR